MASTAGKILLNIQKISNFRPIRRNVTVGKVIFDKSKSVPSTSVPNVPGLTEKVVKIGNEPVGPGAAKNTDYKNPEYFCYDNVSYYEAEVEMLKFRCPQPSIHKPYHHTNPK